MSLDLYLQSAVPTTKTCRCADCGNEHAVSEPEVYFDVSITHNLSAMFGHAGVYSILWRGGGLRAGDVLPKLEAALADMRARPEHFRTFDAPNGWGTYRDAVPWLARVVDACREYPDAVLRCSR